MNEKTLELNVTTELLNISRIIFNPKCYFKGLTLREEGLRGWDTSLVGTSRFLFFQYKAPKGNRYHFIINNNKRKNQHNILYYIIAQGKKGIAYYVFPCYIIETDLAQDSPNLLLKTYFADVADIGILSQQAHQVKICPNHLVARIYSNIRKVPLIRGADLLNILKEANEYNRLTKFKGIYKDEIKKISGLLKYHEYQFSPIKLKGVIF